MSNGTRAWGPSENAAPSPNYRPDIDGLRAIAVLSAVFYHYAVHYVTGGYTGVDVFFVISGFVITQSLMRDHGPHSLIDFYERRVRRILPALIPMLAFVIVGAYVLFTPYTLEQLSEALMAMSVFATNVLFAHETGYFALAVRDVPLMHTWSLSIEEQFYLLYPALLLYLRRRRRDRIVFYLAVLSAASFVLCVVMTELWPVNAFYFGPSRGWELLLGCLLAVARWPAIGNRPALEALACVGLVGLLAGDFLFSPVTSFPGFAALLPCTATAVLIYAGGQGSTLVSRALTTRPMLFFGRISYALYLWHWPILEFTDAWFAGKFSPAIKTAALLVSILLATASTFFIERPFRRKNGIVGRKTLFWLAGGVSLTCAVLGAIGFATGGLPARFSDEARYYASFAAYGSSPEVEWSFRTHICFAPTRTLEFHPERCLKQMPGRKNVLLWGDSLAAQFGRTLSDLAERDGAHLLQATKGACPPLVETPSILGSDCVSFNEAIDAWLAKHTIDGVVLSADWYGYDHSERRSSTIFAELDGTLAHFRARHIPVILIGPMFRYSDSLPRILMLYAQSNHEPDRAPRNYILPGIWPFDSMMRQRYGALPGVDYVSLLDRVCRKGTCPALLADRVPYQFDPIHLTYEGAKATTDAALKAPFERIVNSKAKPPL